MRRVFVYHMPDFGWNDGPSALFDPFDVWFGALSHPHRFDDEPCPEEHRCIGSWAWHYTLVQRYGAENVEKVTGPYLCARDVYGRFDRSLPTATDGCAYQVGDQLRCNHSCLAPPV